MGSILTLKPLAMNASRSQIENMIRTTQQGGEEIKKAVAWFLGLGSSGLVATFLLGDDVDIDTGIAQRLLLCLTFAYVAATGSLIEFTADLETLSDEELTSAKNWARLKVAFLAIGLVMLVGAAY